MRLFLTLIASLAIIASGRAEQAAPLEPANVKSVMPDTKKLPSQNKLPPAFSTSPTPTPAPVPSLSPVATKPASTPTPAQVPTPAPPAIVVQAPSPSPTPQDNGGVSASDPRELLPGENPQNPGWEYTAIYVQRVFHAMIEGTNKDQTLPVRIPVLYKSRSLSLTPDQRKSAAAFLQKMLVLKGHLDSVKDECSARLTEWNTQVDGAIPKEALLPESPTLIENQGTSDLNRGTLQPGFKPGEGVQVEGKP